MGGWGKICGEFSLFCFLGGTFPTGISHRRIKHLKLMAVFWQTPYKYIIDGNMIHSHDYRNMISIWLKAFWIENVWTFNVRTIVGRFPRASLGLADSFCCSTLDRKENFWTDQQRFSEVGESHVILFDDDDDEYCWLNVDLIGPQRSDFSSLCVLPCKRLRSVGQLENHLCCS